MVQTNSLEKQKIVVIVGPTASGKTSVGVRLAQKFNGEIISADSMQIYKQMNIGTAKVTKEEMQGVAHHLIDIVNPTENFSVALWVKLAQEKITEIINRGKTPIIVGGTGLYVTSLLNGYSFYDVPENQELREHYRNILINEGEDALYNILKQKNEERAKEIDKSKHKAVIRALEIIEANKETTHIKNNEPYNYLLIGLNHDRESLYNRINKRVDLMINNGLLDEFDFLITKHKLNRTHQSAGAIGYKEIFDLKDNIVSKEKTIELIKQHSRNYAKRQITWFKRMKNIIWFSPISEYEQIEISVDKFLGEIDE